MYCVTQNYSVSQEVNPTWDKLVCCSKGDGKAGVLVALINLLERLEARKRIDVFRTVKDLQEVNPNMNLTAVR